ncbi:hypothetical protein SSCI18S_04838 [Sphingobium scionense]
MRTSEFLLSLLFVGAIVVLGWSKLSRGFGPKKPLEPVALPFMTQREQAMLAALERVLPMYRLHAQVAMGALLKVPLVPGRRRPRPIGIASSERSSTSWSRIPQRAAWSH